MSLGFKLIGIEKRRVNGKKLLKKKQKTNASIEERSVSRSLGSEPTRNLQGLVESWLSRFGSSC